MKVVKEEEEQDGDLFDGCVCVSVVGGGGELCISVGKNTEKNLRGMRIIRFINTQQAKWEELSKIIKNHKRDYRIR